MSDNEVMKIWEASFAESNLSSFFSKELKALARPCFYPAPGSLLPDDDPGIGNTRFGGYPDLPSGMDWPVDNGAAMTFLAQINLGELKKGFIPELPESGWLHFFLGSISRLDNIPHNVLFFNGHISDLKQTRPPEDLTPIEDDFPRSFFSHKIIFEPGFSLSAKTLEQLADLFSLHVYTLAQGCFYTEGTKICGYEVTFAGDPKESAYLYKSGYGLLQTYGQSEEILDQKIENDRANGNYARAGFIEQRVKPLLSEFQSNARGHQLQMKDWLNLFNLGSHDELNMGWLDNGLLQFMIHKDDLSSLNFNNTYCELSSS